MKWYVLADKENGIRTLVSRPDSESDLEKLSLYEAAGRQYVVVGRVNKFWSDQLSEMNEEKISAFIRGKRSEEPHGWSQLFERRWR